MEARPPVRVAVGIIPRKDKILLCQRKPGVRYGLKWEFPGGKAFEHEAIEQTLVRELNEELGIALREIREVHSTTAKYEDGGEYKVTFFVVDSFAGAVTNYVFHNLAWTRTDDLLKHDILDGNKEIVQMIVDGAIPVFKHIEDEE